MSIPKRHSSPENVEQSLRTFFVTTSTTGKRALLQSDRMAMLLTDVMFEYRDRGEYKLHEFVIMRNHFHLLLTVGERSTVERAVQLIKGGFSYRARRELGIQHQIWQRGFSENRVWNLEEYHNFRKYIHQNPVRAGVVKVPEEYPYSTANPKFRRTPIKTAVAKA